MAIQDYKVSENYTGRDISSLSDRPNEDGLTAQQLKARFDQLNKEVIPNYNDLIDALDVILTNDSEDISALYALVEDHEGRLSIVESTLPNKSDVGHNHDERYYTEAESDALLSGKSNVGHTHDDRYYTESEIDSKFSANSASDRARANHTGTQSADTIVDGTTNKTFLATERTKLSGIQTGAEVNQNAFSNIQVGATQIQADQKTDTFTLIAGANISLTPNATNDSITISATGDVSISADNVLVEDVGEYYLGNNVEEILQEVGSALQNISSDAEDVSITDAGDYFVSDNVEGALQEVGADLLDKMNLDGSNSLIDELTFIGNGVLSYDADRQMLQYTNPDGTTNDVGAELWFSEGKASGAIANGSPVQFASIQGDHYLFKTAVPSEINANPSLFMGIATSDIANNAWGKVTHFGVVHDVNTNGWTSGTILWFDSVNGGLTATKPSYPNAQIQVCAVIVASATVGSIIVRPTVFQDAYTRSEVNTLLDAKAPLASPTFTGTVSGITKTMVGLENVDNTSDANKPVSSATQTQIDTRSLKNWIINGGFDVWQRGMSSGSLEGYLADRWYESIASPYNTSNSRQVFTIGQTDVPNNPTYFHRTIVTDAGTSTSYARTFQKIEDVTKLAGKTISISFWVKADSNKYISVALLQRFGDGGSTAVLSNTEKIPITSTWTRITRTLVVPTILGKIVGANNSLDLQFWYTAGSNYASASGSLGNQSGTFDIANVSLVEGSVPVEWQTEVYADVLRQCQRYYYRINDLGSYQSIAIVASSDGSNNIFFINFKQPMRIAPTSIETSGGTVFSNETADFDVSSLYLNYSKTDYVAIIFPSKGTPPTYAVLRGGRTGSVSWIAFNVEL